MNIEMLDQPDAAAPDQPAANVPAPVEARAALALGSTKTEADLLALVEKAKAITLVNSADGREECHAQLMVLVRSRTTIKKVAKDARDDATKFSKAVIEEENRLIAITAAEEARLQKLRDDWDAKVAAEKEAKAAAERARVKSITERIASIRAFSTLAQECRTAARVQELADKLTAMPLDGFEEFTDEATSVLAATAKAVANTLAQKQADEAERARVKAEQEAEAERQRVQAEALARQQAELDAQRAALQAQADAQAAEAKRLQDERDAQAAEAERIAQAAADLSAALDEPQPIALAVEETPGVAEAAPAALADQFPTTNVSPGIQPMEFNRIPFATAPAAELPVTNVVTLARPAAKTERTRPTDADIIGALALHYRVHESTVISWLSEMDLKAVSVALLTEFQA